MPNDGLAGSQDAAQNSHTPSPIQPSINFADAELPGPKRLGLSVQSNQGFRQHHAVALTTVLHRCLLQGDYLRAGRTWGILLRMRISTESLDLRTDDHWGLGAEILYNQLISNSTRQEGEPLVDGNDENEDSPLKSFNRFNPEGFKEAQEYYERLILQYPYQKRFPNLLNALDFYPAMFGLWIYAVQQQQQQHEFRLQHRGEADPKIKEQPSEAAQSGEQTLALGLEMKEDPRLAEAYTVYVDRAREIQNQLDVLLLSPPFSDNARLCNLQSMVNQWVSHISNGNFKNLEMASAKEEDKIGSTGSHWMDS